MNSVLFLVEGQSDAIFIYNLFKRKYNDPTLDKKGKYQKHWEIFHEQFGMFTIHVVNGAKSTFTTETSIIKMQGYKNVHNKIFILVDQDSDNKLELENEINALFVKHNIIIEAVIIACDELEAWFLADSTLDIEPKNKKASKSSLKLGLIEGQDKYNFADEYSKVLSLNRANNSNASFHCFLEKCGFIFC